MRISGRFVDRREVKPAVEALNALGLNREDIVISDMAGRLVTEQGLVRDENTIIGEPASIPVGEGGSIVGGFAGLNRESGLIVAVEIQAPNRNRVHEILKRSGAIEVFEG